MCVYFKFFLKFNIKATNSIKQVILYKGKRIPVIFLKGVCV